MTKRIMQKLAFLLSVVMVVSLFANVNWTVRAADVGGQITVNFTGYGTLDYVFYDSNDTQCIGGGAGIISYESSNKTFEIPPDAVKMVLKARSAENWQTAGASGTKNDAAFSDVDGGIFGEAGKTITDFTNEDGFTINLTFTEKPQQPGSDIGAGDVQFEVQNSQSGTVYYSFTGAENSWVETGNNQTIDKNTVGDYTTIYVKAVPNGGQSVDAGDYANYVDIQGNPEYFAANDLTSGTASFTYDKNSAHKVHIQFAGSAPAANAGYISLNIENAQNGAVQYKIGEGNWQSVSGSNFTLRKDVELQNVTDGATILFQATPNQEQSLDTNAGQNWIEINGQSRTDIDTTKLLAGSYSITYNSVSTYSMQIKFNGGNGGDGGNGATSYGKDGILEFNIENSDQGDVFFQIGEGTRYRVGGTEEVSEETIQNALSETTFTESDTIKVWAEERGGKIVGNFDIRIGGTSVFVTDDERTAARTAAESGDGYTFTVPAGYNGQDRIEFAIEFRDETPGGGNNDYDAFYPDVDSGLYMVELKNCNASCGSVSFVTEAEAGKVNPEDENVSKSRFQGNTVIISFTPVEGEYVDRIQIGQTEYRPGDANFDPPSNMGIEGEVFTYTTQASDFDEYGYLYIEVGFTGGSNGVNCYGKDDKLAFNIANSDKGNVFFQIGEEKYRVGGDDRYSESTIIDTLKDKEFAAAETITIWAENRDGVNVSHFDIRIAGNSVLGDDATRDEAKNAAQGESGYTFTVPESYTSDKQIEFQIEFFGGGGGDNDVTYTEDATISEDTIKNDITVSAGTLTIENCSVRVDHRLVVESGATIVGTSASSKLIFAGGAFSSGIALYYQDEKISDDNNNDFSNNGDGPVEFIWNTTSSRWVTEQPPAEGGGDAPWYTVSYGSSANLNTKNGKVYTERVHIGDITYSSIASEYNASDTDKIYSMEDTIFRQKTEEEENNPDSGYVDPLMKYGIGGSDGDIMIRPDVSGVSIDFKFIPDFGYQLTNIYTNEEEKDTLLNDFVAAEAVSSFTFDVKQGNNVHFQVKFEEVDNKVTGNAEIASSAKIESTNAAASGTLEMKVDNATASSDIPSGSEALAAYDITLTNVVSKGGDRGSWDTPLEDLGENVATVTLPLDDSTDYTYSVIREHEGEDPVTLDATVTDGAISFDTNKFSKYTIVKTPVAKSSIEKAEITLGDVLTYNGREQTQTIAGVKVDGKTLTEGTDYTVTGNTGTDVNTYTLTITGTGNYTGTANKAWSIGEKSITGATITLGDALTYNGTAQTQTVSSVAIGESTLASNTDYTISGNQQKDAGTYTLTVTGTGNYTGTVTTQFTIGKKSVTPALTGTATKAYDNTTTVPESNSLSLTVTGTVSPDTLTVSATGYAYDDANVGSGKTITATGITISGDAAKNYVLSGTTATVAGGKIDQATPTITLSNLSETTQAPTGAKATLNLADASAQLVIEYQVLDTPAATYKWVTTRPTTPGTYQVRAYLPTGTTNVAAIAVENAVTGSYTLTQYTAPSGGGSNSGSDSGSNSGSDSDSDSGSDSDSSGSSSSGSTTTPAPTTPAQAEVKTPASTENTTTRRPVPATEESNTETTSEKTIGVSSEDGAGGWTNIKTEINDKLANALEAEGGEEVVVTVEMNGENTVPADIFENIKGQDITVTFDMGNGIVWAVNGMDVTADSFEDINFSASTGDGVTAIPAELMSGLTEERFSMELTLEYEGEFGFAAVMSVNVDKKNAGKYANLFYFSPKAETMEFICSAPVKEDGTTDLTFTHASDYVIVVDEVAMSAANNMSMDKVEQSVPQETPSELSPVELDTAEKDAFNPLWIFVIGIVVLLIGGIAIFAVKMKKE